MPILFNSGDGSLYFKRLHIPFPWTCPYSMVRISGEHLLRDFNFDSLIEGEKVWEGRECSHLKYSDVTYRPANCSLVEQQPPSTMQLALPCSSYYIDGRQVVAAGLKPGHYQFEKPRPAYGGCLEAFELTLESDGSFNGHFIAYPGWSIPRGFPYEISFYTQGGTVYVLSVYRDNPTYYTTYAWEYDRSIAFTGSAGPLPEYGSIYHDFKALITPEWDAGAQHCMAVRQAINELDVIGINWYENLAAFAEKSLMTLGQIGERMLQHVNEAKNATGLGLAKILSSAYLSKKYGLDNDIRDVASLRSGIPALLDMIQQSELTLHGSCSAAWSNDQSVGTICSRATVYCQPFLSGRVWDDVLGITPSASNLWAIVPFSFAVDWILHCADNLSQIEEAAGFGSNRWHVSHLWYCDKAFGSSPTPEISGWVPSSEVVEWSVFKRTSSIYLPDYVYDPPDYGLHGLKNHVFETIALILNAF